MVDIGTTTQAKLRDTLVAVLTRNLQQRVAGRVRVVDGNEQVGAQQNLQAHT